MNIHASVYMSWGYVHVCVCTHMFFFFHMEMLRVWYSMPVCTSVTVHIDSVYAVCACVWRVCVCLRGLTGGLGLNLNAGHCAACRFRFCLSALFCAQDGNPSNMARIRIKSNSPPPSRCDRRPSASRGPMVHPEDLAGDPAKCQFPYFDVFQRVWTEIVLSIRTGTKLTRALG